MNHSKVIKPGKWYTEFDENGNCTAAVYDASYRILLGYRSEEEYADAQETWTSNIHPDDAERLNAHLTDCIAKHPEGMDFDIEYRMMTKWGYRWFHDYAHVNRREDGSPIRADGVVFDIEDIVNKTETHQSLSENYTRILALEDDFEVLYDIDLDTGKYDIFVKGQTFGDVNNNLINNNSFFDDVEKNLQVVHPDDRQGNYDTTRPDFIREALSKEEHFDRYYRLMVDGNPAWAKMRIVYKDASKKRIIIGVFNAQEERSRAKQIENDLVMSKLRADSLAFISDNEPDLDRAISFFGKRILEISGCDQVVYRELGGRKIVMNVPGCKEIPESICSRCPFARFDCEAFGEDGTVLMNDCGQGYHGVMVPADCPAKSSFMQMIYSGGELVGKLTVHYLNDYHTFSENGISVMKTVAIYMGLLIGRIKEKQAEIARIEAESSNKAKTAFLFNMSHDIRTPMNAILGYTDIALNHVDEPERVNDSLRKIKTSGGHLLSLINDILEMSRIESGKLEIVNAPINIFDVTEGITHMSQALASAKDIVFNVRLGGLKNPYVYSDELHTNQIIINLISNAIKYTAPGGTVDYCIEQISDPAGGVANYRVTVKDNGIGMSEAFQQHLFESFVREQNMTVSKQEGAGLGLAIVKRIVDLMGGTIHAKSKQGEGSVFTVELPLEVMDDAAIEAFEAARNTVSEACDNLTLEGRKVLLVEDNEMNREIATEILEETGLIIDTAEDGAEAVGKVTEKGAGYYDFILMDIQMPVMNGYEATAEIRKLPDGGNVPIIALYANAFKEDVAKSLAAGMDAHVAKPINIPELLGALTKFI